MTSSSENRIEVPEEWHAALAAIREAAGEAAGREPPVREPSGRDARTTIPDRGVSVLKAPPHVVYVIGAPDSGKSTFCRWVCEQLGQSTAVALLDADPGQGVLGPPTAISLGGPARPGRRAEGGPTTPRGSADVSAARAPLHHAFVGDTTPRGSLLQLATALRVLHLRAQEEGAELTIVDACGFVAGAIGRELHLHSIDLLSPRGLVIIGNLPVKNGLSSALAAARRAERVIHLSVSPAAGRRSIAHRRVARLENFRHYFADAAEQTISLEGRELRGYLPRPDEGGEPDDRAFVAGRAVGLCDGRGEMLALGRAEGMDRRHERLQLVGPAVEVELVSSVRIGRARIPDDALTRQTPPSPPSSHHHARRHESRGR